MFGGGGGCRRRPHQHATQDSTIPDNLRPLTTGARIFDEGMELARQTARHGHPLTRRTTVNLLTLVINGEDRARAFEAAVDAWKRGQLPEGFQPHSIPDRSAAWAAALRALS